jgi:hypothetical protein
MANFLDDISVYNAKAAAAITLAVTQGNSPKANLMSSLKTTANDITLTDDVRLEALTALINIGSLLDIPLPPYFPVTTSFADSQTYVGVHNDLSGLNVGDYQHLTATEKSAILGKASLSDITFANLLGVYTDNASLVNGFATKQNALNGTGYVIASGGTITYDNSTLLTTITGIVAAATPGGGQITGTYASPVISNAAVIGKVLTGFNGSAATGTITGSDSILTAMEKLNANIEDVIATSGTINEITFALPSSVFSYTAGPFNSGSAPLSGTFINQSQNRFFAGPSSGGSGQPSFRAIVAGDFPASGASAGTYGSASSIPQITVDAYGRVTNIANVTAASGGQVNTITYSVPAGVFTSSVTGTSAVSITLGLGTQTATYVWAGPISGAAAGPTFRALVATDIPSITPSQVTGLGDLLDGKLDNTLSNGNIWIGNTSNAAVPKVLSGDVTVDNLGVTAIGLAKVQYDMIQDVTTQTLLGRYAAVDGEVQQITLNGTDFVLNSGTGVLSLAVPVAPVVSAKGDLLGHDLTTQQRVPSNNIDGSILLVNNSATGAYTDLGLNWVAMSGDATIGATGALTIANSAVTLAKMANLAANSFIGNNTGSSATPIALTATQATAMLDQFTTSAKGLVPAASFTPAVGKILADYFLNASGAWSLGGGSGGTTTNALTIGSGLSGTAGTFNGSAAVTVSLNTGNANTWTALQTFEGNIYLGAAGGSAGSARFRGSTSGYVILQAPAAPANQTYLLPAANGTTGQFLKLSDSGTGQMAWDTVTETGDVTGPASATANAIAVFNGITGKIIKDSGVTFPIGFSNGGTGQTTQQAALNALAVTVTSGQYLRGNGTNVVMSSIQAGDVPTLNQNTTGTAAGLSSTLVIASGGTNGTATPTAGTIAYGTGTAYAFTAAGTAGQILQSNGASAPSWVSGLTNPMTSVGDLIVGGASGAATRLGPIGGNGTVLTSNGTTASWQAASATLVVGTSAITSGTIGRVLFQGTGNVLQQSANLFWDNTNGRLSVGGNSSPSGLLQVAAGTGSVPQFVLVPSSAVTISGTTNGSIWYDTVSSNSSLTLYKDTGYTKLITKDRNPDFVSATTSGVIVSDANGTLTKSADLTALGVYAQTTTTTAITTGSGSLIGTVTGSTTLSTNFFATGKTLEFLFAGLISTNNSGGPSVAIDIKITDGTTTVTLGTLTYDTSSLSGRVYMGDIELTCRTSGSNPTFGIAGQMIVNHTSKSQETVFITPGSVTATGLNTSSALTLQLTATWTNPGASSSIDTRVNYCQYIN